MWRRRRRPEGSRYVLEGSDSRLPLTDRLVVRRTSCWKSDMWSVRYIWCLDGLVGSDI